MDSITVSNQVKRSKIHGFCVKEDVQGSKKTQGVKACYCHFTAGAMKGTCRFETSECRLPKKTVNNLFVSELIFVKPDERQTQFCGGLVKRQRISVIIVIDVGMKALSKHLLERTLL